MKSIFGAACATLVLASLTPMQAWANPQHERMKRCNAEAKAQALKGEEREVFMGTCLRGKHDAAVGTVPAAAPAVPPAAAVVPVAKPAAVTPAATATAPATAAAQVAPVAVAAPDKAREKACNRAATEQSLRGAKRKAFITECLSG
ncbi:PsiF family protein [Thauera sp.]|jgi:hypothetical protein|uniref:PsiF family protein n=1 Tax=Thauera sp. TaxID=1905334 RepID=UPI0026289D20|nr:PsiF family protein [Thauera sp.]MCK6409744.1 PsiF family protein [Thauera sp.]